MGKDFSNDQETLILANQIRDLLGKHLNSDNHSYQELITSSLIALCIEVGRLKWLAVATDEVGEEKFDMIFLEGMMNHYNENKKRYGTLN